MTDPRHHPDTAAYPTTDQTRHPETNPPAATTSDQHAAATTGADAPTALPREGMVVTVLTREDVVVMDPDRLLAAGRRAYQADDPDATEDEVMAAVVDVADAVFALLDRYGSAASEHPDVAAGATARRRMHGGTGYLPGDHVHDRTDGLSPAGTLRMIVLDEPRTVQSYGCVPFEFADMFAGPAHRGTS